MRVAIVNDTRLIAEALRRHVMQEHEVIWVASSGMQALQFCADNRPDLILMDLVMPEMDGVETTRLIMQSAPCAILIVTASPEQRTGQIFRALGAGALDVTATPVIGGNTGSTTGNAADSCQLLKKIKTIGRLISAPPARPHTPTPALPSAMQGGYGRTQAKVLVAIGASTGGPVALAKLLSMWTPPADCALVLVQHIDSAFTDSFAQWLSAQISF
ncbi:MAG: response regulator, partial [Giesbergeria sp.]|nr:response regulator [Giesbergeria sp.]